ncbi:MAG: hypothetical protein K2Q20_10390 [Phycisphaerales bacterium]|nr:hypothetical protein [Phycisphaerales bacterium]
MPRPRLLPVVAAALILSGLGACKSHHGSAHEEEQAVTMAQLPAPVLATLQRESAGGEIKSIEREVKKGKAVYEADVLVAGSTWELKIADDGTLLSKKEDKD